MLIFIFLLYIINKLINWFYTLEDLKWNKSKDYKNYFQNLILPINTGYI